MCTRRSPLPSATGPPPTDQRRPAHEMPSQSTARCCPLRAGMRSLPHRWSPRMRAARRLAALGERRKVVEHIAVDRARVTLLEHVGLAALQAQARGKDVGRGQSTSATRVGRPTRITILPWRAAGPCVMTIICGGAICVMPPSMWGERLWKSMTQGVCGRDDPVSS